MSAWGSFWGGVGDAISTLWVYVNRDVPYSAAVGQIIESRFERIDAVARKIEGAFDLDTATGVALEIWGARLGLARLGLDDDTYRRALRVQRSLLLSSAGTRENLIAIFEAWTETPVTEYATHGKTIHIAGDVDAEDEYRLGGFLERAKPAGRQLRVYDVEGTDLICDYALDPLAEDTGTLDYGLAPVTGAATLAGRIPT